MRQPSQEKAELGRSGCAPTAIAAPLLDWYDRHARTLPWRVPPADRMAGVLPDPYRVWLSEIMLQQTTVAAVKSYFAAFTARWPRVEALAAAEDAEVMGAWAGLGYYARARNLLRCARTVVDAHDGRFPETEPKLRALPGIGAYTAAAIAAIAFDEPAAVVDGNVERVTSRLHAIDEPLPGSRKIIRTHVEATTPPLRPGDFAQAMMDLGATICTPKRPACVICPVAGFCVARQSGTQDRFPVKMPKASRPFRRGAAFVAERLGDGAVWLQRRPPAGLLGGMAEPPTTNWGARRDGATDAGAAPFSADWRFAGTVTHGFTHFELALDVWSARLVGSPAVDGWWASPISLDGEALPTLMRRVVALGLSVNREGEADA